MLVAINARGVKQMAELPSIKSKLIILCSACKGEGGAIQHLVSHLLMGVSGSVMKPCEYCYGSGRLIQETETKFSVYKPPQ